MDPLSNLSSCQKTVNDGQLALHLFCQDPDAIAEECKHLIATNPSAVFKRDLYGRTVSCPQLLRRLTLVISLTLLHC